MDNLKTCKPAIAKVMFEIQVTLGLHANVGTSYATAAATAATIAVPQM
jgi:hypothetical protein